MKTIALLILFYFFLKKTMWAKYEYATVTLVAIGVILLDLGSKHIIESISETIHVSVLYNTGAVFGFDLGIPLAVWIGVAVLVSGLLWICLKHREHHVVLGLMLGGIWANTIDRMLTQGAVRDWLHVPFYEMITGIEMYNNVADWALALGVLIWIYQLFFKTKTS